MNNKAPTAVQIAAFADDMYEAGIPASKLAVYMNAPAMVRHDVAADHRITRNQTRFMGFNIEACWAIAIDDLGNAFVLMRGNRRAQFMAGEEIV